MITETKTTPVGNGGRQFELDLAKFFAIAFMILVHCYDYSPLYLFPDDAASGDFSSMAGTVIEFLGAQPAAPVFMFCMGIGMVYTRHGSPADFARRGLRLFVTGYLLNLYRSLFVAGILLFGDLGDAHLTPFLVAFALCVDILPFAGLTFLFFALMKHLRVSHGLSAAIVLLLLLIGNVLPTVGNEETWYSYLAGLLWYQNNFTSFPLFQWLSFPMAGVLFGACLKRSEVKSRLYARTFFVGLMLFLASTAVACLLGKDLRTFFTTCYFDMDVLQTVWSMGIVLLLLSLYFVVAKVLRHQETRDFASFCSRNVNSIYLWQWGLITPVSALSLAGLLPVDTFFKLIVEAVIIFAACVAIVKWRRQAAKGASVSS